MLALMTMQLMAKHRYLLRLDRANMQEIEERVEGLPNLVLHHVGTDVDKAVHASWATKRPSVGIWQAGLLCFLLLNIAILVLALVQPELFT